MKMTLNQISYYNHSTAPPLPATLPTLCPLYHPLHPPILTLSSTSTPNYPLVCSCWWRWIVYHLLHPPIITLYPIYSTLLTPLVCSCWWRWTVSSRTTESSSSQPPTSPTHSTALSPDRVCVYVCVSLLALVVDNPPIDNSYNSSHQLRRFTRQRSHQTRYVYVCVCVCVSLLALVVDNPRIDNSYNSSPPMTHSMLSPDRPGRTIRYHIKKNLLFPLHLITPPIGYPYWL